MTVTAPLGGGNGRQPPIPAAKLKIFSMRFHRNGGPFRRLVVTDGVKRKRGHHDGDHRLHRVDNGTADVHHKGHAAFALHWDPQQCRVHRLRRTRLAPAGPVSAPLAAAAEHRATDGATEDCLRAGLG